MSMQSGSGNTGLTNEPNVTPMIDVLMVLLIIFMVIVPSSRKAIDVQLPDPNPTPSSAPNTSQIVLSVHKNGAFEINKESQTLAALPGRLKEIYDPRPDKIIFIKGDPDATYQEVIQAADIARGAGVKIIGFTPKAAQ